MTPARAGRPPLGVLAALFLCSGAGALIVETMWLRWLRLVFGATAPAASATLVAFFSGHAIGAALAARWIGRARRPLLVYGGLELAAAACALATPALLAAGGGALAAGYDGLRESQGALAAARYALALAATLPAAACFGATLPALGAAAMADVGALGRAGSRLYAVNTLGAALGTALAAFVLPDRLGVRGTYGVGLALLAGVGAAALALGARTAGGAPPRAAGADPGGVERGPRRAAGVRAVSPAALAALAGLSGFGSFATQVLCIHAFAQVLNQSVFAFGAVLVVVLAALALGAEMVARLAGRAGADPRSWLGAALAASALLLAAFPALLSAATGGLAYVGSGRPWPVYLFEAIGTVTVTAGPALLAAALVFPLCFALAARGGAGGARGAGRDAGAALGRLVAANTLGAIAGALAAPYLLLPAAGLWGAFGCLSLVYAGAALGLRDATPRRYGLRAGALAAGGALLLAAASPFGEPLVRLAPGESLLAARSGASGVVAVVERPAPGGGGRERLIRTDNHYTLGGTSQRTHQERQGHLPLLLHPSARRVVYAGSATGISAGAALLHPIERLFVVELVPEVARAARRHFAASNRRVYEDARTELVLDDARNFLRATRERFDLVVADLFVPWRSGTGALYTREHFTAVRAHLAPDGVFCQWLPLYQLSEAELLSIAATFLDVFPRSAVFRGDFYGRFPIAALVGFAGAAAPAGSVSQAAGALAARGVDDRWVADPAGPWALYVGPLAGVRDALAGAPRNTDDRPHVQYLAARAHVGGERGKADPFVGLAFARFAQAIRRRARAAPALYPELPAAARRAADGGAALQSAGAFYVEGRPDDAARAFAAAAELLPPRLLRDAPPDPTAAEVWLDESAAAF